ncbi:MAG: HigA family addiction module antitoxin [Pseudomonadota bacterium]|nr:HigA family addiction module antitoxin [Pseudomonadota bacterium]
MNMHSPAHAGQLIAEWLDGLKDEGTPISITQLAARIQVTRAALSRIINGKAALTADVALRLQAALGINADLLMRVQVAHELWTIAQRPRPDIQPLCMPT